MSVEPLESTPDVDITTGTGDFIATDRQPQLLRSATHDTWAFGRRHRLRSEDHREARGAQAPPEAFERVVEGELVVFSGVTDCYQPLGSELRLTRGMSRGLRRVPQPGGDHHQVAADRA